MWPRRKRDRAAPGNADGARDRVLLVDLALKYGGTEGRVLHLAESLVAQGAEVLVACLVDGMLYARLREAGIPCAPLRLRRGDPRLLWSLLRLARRHRAQVVDTHGVHSQFWGIPAAALARVPSRVVTVHSEYAVEQQGLRRGRWYEAVLRGARAFDVEYIAVSVPVRDYLLEAGLPEPRITMIWNAVPPPTDSALGDREATRAALGLSEGDFALITVARLHRSKGHRHLLDALAAVVEDLPQLHWFVVGEGKEQSALEQRAAGLGLGDRVTFLGFRDDVPALVRACDAFVFPSLAEGLPLAVLEAAWQGTPVLASAVGGLPYVFDEDEVLLVPPADVGALEDGLRRIVTDPDFARRLGERGRAVTRDRLSTETMINATRQVYRRR